MHPDTSTQISSYLCALRGTSQLDGPLAPYLFLTLTTLARPHEFGAPGTTSESTGTLAVQNTVGLTDVRHRALPLANSAAQTIRASGGLDALLASITHGCEALPQALHRQLTDAEGLNGMDTVEEVWRLAVSAVVAAVPAELVPAVLRYAGLAPAVPSTGKEVDLSVLVVAAAVDELVRQAGFQVAPSPDVHAAAANLDREAN